jgi:uncharacterized protein with PQ loop repeat
MIMNFLVASAGFLNAAAIFHQALKIVETEDSSNVSMVMLGVFLFIQAVYAMRGIERKDIMLTAGMITSAGVTGLALALALVYAHPSSIETPNQADSGVTAVPEDSGTSEPAAVTTAKVWEDLGVAGYLSAGELELTVANGTTFNGRCAEREIRFELDSTRPTIKWTCGSVIGEFQNEGLTGIMILGRPVTRSVSPFLVCQDTFATLVVPPNRNEPTIIRCRHGTEYSYPDGAFYRFVLIQ